MNHRIFERKLRSRGLTPREHVRLSAASISIHSTSLIYSTHRGGGIVGERALPPPAAVAWPQIVYGDCAPTHTQIYILSCARLSCVVAVGVGRSVGRLVVCVCLCMGLLLLSTHTRYSGLCCSALLRLPPFIGRRLCMAYGTLNSIMPCLCVDAISLIYIYLWCVCVSRAHTHPRHHQPLSNTRTRMHMSSRACIPKVICICEHGAAQCTHLTTTTTTTLF